jgi:hypothetical protein
MTKQTALQNVLKDPMDREAWRVLGEVCNWGECISAYEHVFAADYIDYGVHFMQINLNEGRPEAEKYLLELVWKVN